MRNKSLTGFIAGSLLMASTAAVAQTGTAAPALEPAAESVGSGTSSLMGRPDYTAAAIFFTVAILLVVFQDDLFGDDDPVSP